MMGFPHLLDTGRLSWGIDEERVYTCPCGAWQLHVPAGIAVAMMPHRSLIYRVDSVHHWFMDGIRALNRAMDDALWEHEAECPVLQNAAVQAGVVRRELHHPYIYSMTRDRR